MLWLRHLLRLLFGFVDNISSIVERKTTMHQRDRTDIIRRILEVANGAENITKTKLMYRGIS